MRLPSYNPASRSWMARRAESAFTLVELLTASSLSIMTMAALASFMYFAARSMSGVITQSSYNTDSGLAAQFIMSRVRVATSVETDRPGTSLTLGFDDNPTADSNNDGKPYNDQNHFEQFQFLNGDGNDLTTADNKLVYWPNIALQDQQRLLLRSGVRKLRNQRIFAITNLNTVLINYGLEDACVTDFRQSLDMQLVAVPRNRPLTTNVIELLP